MTGVEVVIEVDVDEEEKASVPMSEAMLVPEKDIDGFGALDGRNVEVGADNAEETGNVVAAMSVAVIVECVLGRAFFTPEQIEYA